MITENRSGTPKAVPVLISTIITNLHCFFFSR